MRFTAVFEKVPEGYIAFVEEVPGANTQGATLEEARANLVEAVEMILEANRTLAEELVKGKTVIRESFPASDGMKRDDLVRHLELMAVSSCERAASIRFT